MLRLWRPKVPQTIKKSLVRFHISEDIVLNSYMDTCKASLSIQNYGELWFCSQSCSKRLLQQKQYARFEILIFLCRASVVCKRKEFLGSCMCAYGRYHRHLYSKKKISAARPVKNWEEEAKSREGTSAMKEDKSQPKENYRTSNERSHHMNLLQRLRRIMWICNRQVKSFAFEIIRNYM